MAANFAYFSVLPVGLTCLGGVLENRRVWHLLEAGRMLLIGAGVVLVRGWFGGVTDSLWVAGIAGFTAISLLWLGDGDVLVHNEKGGQPGRLIHQPHLAFCGTKPGGNAAPSP